MRPLQITSLFLVLAGCASQPSPQPAAALSPAAPATEVHVVTETLHGVEISDPYRWLEDQEAPATRDWITRQNAYTDAVLGSRAEAGMFAPRLMELQNTDKNGTPWYRGGRYFNLRRGVGQDLYSIYMREPGGGDQVLIAPAPWSTDHRISTGINDVTSDGKLLAYYVRKGGADEVEVRFFDVDARKDTGAPLSVARYSGISIGSGRQVYFTRHNPVEGPRVYRRSLDGGEETKLFGDGYGPEMWVSNSQSDDGRYMLIHVFEGINKSQIYLDDLRDDAPAKVVVNDLAFRSSGEMAGDSIVIQTNWDAPNDRVFVAPAATPGREHWKEIVPENKKASIQGTSLAGGRVFVSYLEDVKPRIVGYDLSGQKQEEIAFETLGNLASVSGTWESPLAFFSFSSFHVPPTIYQYDVARGQRSEFSRESAPVVSDNFTVEQVWYPSKDGTRVPMFLMYKKGLQRNGANPTYLTGYGGFTSTEMPTFSSKAIAWAEQGGVYAVANLRGGGEFGEQWHRAGMLDRKQNTFDDFIAAGEFLIRERYTSSRHLGIAGGSNGGLLVMAVATQRPDLAEAVVCTYPLIDMLRYQKFLVARFWVPEYGDPEKADEFPWLYAYSPYQKVKPGTAYPATLFITGDADTRVAPLHARKMTALLQRDAGNTPDDPILLRYHVAGGHSGGEPRQVQVKNNAEELGFMYWQLK